MPRLMMTININCKISTWTPLGKNITKHRSSKNKLGHYEFGVPHETSYMHLDIVSVCWNPEPLEYAAIYTPLKRWSQRVSICVDVHMDKC